MGKEVEQSPILKNEELGNIVLNEMVRGLFGKPWSSVENTDGYQYTMHVWDEYGKKRAEPGDERQIPETLGLSAIGQEVLEEWWDNIARQMFLCYRPTLQIDRKIISFMIYCIIELRVEQKFEEVIEKVYEEERRNVAAILLTLGE